MEGPVLWVLEARIRTIMFWCSALRILIFATWRQKSQGLVSTQLYSLGVAQTSPFVMGGGTQDQGIIRSDGSPNWVDTGAGNEGGFFIVDPNNSSNIYVTPWSTNLRRSTDSGITWTTI